jgi:mRNA interferase MazF
VQADAFLTLPSVIVLLLTGEITDELLLRITVSDGRDSGLHKPSKIMIDKLFTVSRKKIGRHIGRLDATTMRAVDLALARILGLAGASGH